MYRYIKAFERYTKRNIIVYYSGFLFVDANTGIQEEDMNGFMSAVHKMDKEKGLDLFLHTPGGLVSATEGIGNYLKERYEAFMEGICRN